MAEEIHTDVTERLLREERLRAMIAEKLDSEKAKPRSLLSDNGKWLVVTILIPVVTALHGYFENRSAEIRAKADKEIAAGLQAQEAVLADARNDVTAMTALLPALSDPDPAKAELALVVLARLEAAQHGPDKAEVRAVYEAMRAKIDAQRNSGNEKDAYRGARKLEALFKATGSTRQPAAAADSPPVTSTAAVVPVRPERVYIQVFTEAQRPDARRVQEALRNQGVAVPEIEDVGRLAKGTLPGWQIRYFADADLGAATWTRDRLAALGFKEFQIFRVRAAGRVPPGQVELWWPNSRER